MVYIEEGSGLDIEYDVHVLPTELRCGLVVSGLGSETSEQVEEGGRERIIR